MSLRKHGLKALGLSILAAIGVMAFSASAAQAENDCFKILGTCIAAEKTATGEVDTLGILEVEGLNVEIDCSAFDVKSGKLLTGGVGEAELLYLGCVMKQLSPLEVLTNCKIKDGGIEGDITADGKLKTVLHNGAAYVLVEALVANGNLATVHTENCPVGESLNVKGTVALSTLPEASVATSGAHIGQQLVEASTAIQTLLGDELKYGGNLAKLLGSAWVTITGNTCKWGIV